MKLSIILCLAAVSLTSCHGEIIRHLDPLDHPLCLYGSKSQ